MFHRGEGGENNLDAETRKGCLEKVVLDIDFEGWMKVQNLEQSES